MLFLSFFQGLVEADLFLVIFLMGVFGTLFSKVTFYFFSVKLIFFSSVFLVGEEDLVLVFLVASAVLVVATLFSFLLS